jgi:hypothetical protein
MYESLPVCVSFPQHALAADEREMQRTLKVVETLETEIAALQTKVLEAGGNRLKAAKAKAEAMGERLNEAVRGGGRIKAVVYTSGVARCALLAQALFSMRRRCVGVPWGVRECACHVCAVVACVQLSAVTKAKMDIKASIKNAEKVREGDKGSSPQRCGPFAFEL